MTGEPPPGRDILLLCTADQGLADVVGAVLHRHRLSLSCERDAARGLDAGDHFALVLMDMAGHGPAFPSLLQALRRRSSVPLIAIAPDAHPQNACVVLDSGADDCVGRPIHGDDLVARIHALLRRSRRPPSKAPGPILAADLRVDPVARTVAVAGDVVRCTPAEYDVVECLARSAGQVVSRDTLFAVVCGRAPAPLDRAVDVHVSHVRRKLQRSSTRIVTVRGVGYMLTPCGS